MPKTTSSDEPADTTPEPAAEPESTGNATQDELNKIMAEQAETDQIDEARRNEYPPGSDVLTADNARRYPDLFTEEQRNSVLTDEELPETDTEKAQREYAEAQEASSET